MKYDSNKVGEFVVVKKELKKFIEDKIFPIYDTFDKGHDIQHIQDVIKRSLELYRYLNDNFIDINIVYASAALHDIGILVERKNHALHSQEFVLNCSELKSIFTEEEINIIGQAVLDHSTSKGIEPRSIYGKIVCDADKDDNLEISLLRAYEYTKKYYPNFTEEECLENVYKQLSFKYGENGKVKFWINSKKQEEFRQKMYELALDKDLYIKTINKILDRKKYYKR